MNKTKSDILSLGGHIITLFAMLILYLAYHVIILWHLGTLIVHDSPLSKQWDFVLHMAAYL